MAGLKYEIRNCKVCGKPHGFCTCKPEREFEYVIGILNEELIHKKKLLIVAIFEVNKNFVRDIIFELQQAISILEKAGEPSQK